MHNRFSAVIGATLLIAGLAASAMAQTVQSVSIDSDTGGDWRGKYGQCLQIIPQPKMGRTEEPVPTYPWPAGDWSNVCVNGKLEDQNLVSFRFFRKDEANAFAWRYCDAVNAGSNGTTPDRKPTTTAPPANDSSWTKVGDVYVPNECLGSSFRPLQHYVDPDAAQWNSCLGKFLNGTFDNDTFTTDPLTNELTLKTGGDATLAYYFLNGQAECRQLRWKFYIGTVTPTSQPVRTGIIQDLAGGKYLVIKLTGIPAGGAKFTLKVEDANGGTGVPLVAKDGQQIADPNVCPGSPYPDANSVISAVYVGGTSACTEPPPTCQACSGGIKSLTLKWLGSKRAKITVKRPDGDDADYAPDTLFNDYVDPSETFTIDDDGAPVGKYLYIYVNGYKVTVLKTDCSQQLGPGFQTYFFRVVAGTSVNGGALCPVKKYCYYHRTWDCKEHRYCPVHQKDHGDDDRCDYDRDDKDTHTHGLDCDRDRDGKCDHPYDKRCKHDASYVRGDHNHGSSCDRNHDGKCDHPNDPRCHHSKWTWSSWWW